METMKTITLTTEEIEALPHAINAAREPIMVSVSESVTLDSSTHTKLSECIRARLAWMVGEGQWHHYLYAPLRSVMFKLEGVTLADAPLKERLAWRGHPPSDRLLSCWALSAEELDRVWSGWRERLARDCAQIASGLAGETE